MSSVGVAPATPKIELFKSAPRFGPAGGKVGGDLTFDKLGAVEKHSSKLANTSLQVEMSSYNSLRWNKGRPVIQHQSRQGTDTDLVLPLSLI